MGFFDDVVDLATAPFEAVFGGGAEEPSSSKTASKISRAQWTAMEPLYSDFVNQMLELLQTGGISAQVPMISNAVEQNRTAASNALVDLDKRLAQMGLAGTPFGERVRGETQMQGELAVSQTPFDVYRQLLSMLPGFLTGQGNTIMTGLNTATQGAIGAQQNSNQAMNNMMQLLPVLLAL